MQYDCGCELYDHVVQKLFNDRNFKHYSSLNYDIKAAVVELFNKLLKSNMLRYFVHRKTCHWVDVPDKLIES